ncbi:methyltransferase [Xanthomonas nasturtii]|uniref:methyltransferase n=1 Tax=Xanthomonas nasturtii TaxID=1843581 RepID=UPI002B233B60|nr:methyltransferase [Xanthomonas nasturtii]MEA9578765.1 methyltransferase [Xanthomonas nasturtii]
MLQGLFARQRRASVPSPLFSVCQLQLSEQVHWLDSKGLLDPLPYVQRHLRGDWGEVDEARRRANEGALQAGGVLQSQYRITPRLALLVLTDEARHRTVVRLPEEPDPR